MSRQAIHTDSAVASPAYSQAIISGLAPSKEDARSCFNARDHGMGPLP